MPKSTYLTLTTTTLILTYLVILLGAATRVYDAGLSCPDWPTCYGYWWPWPEAKIIGGYYVQGVHYTGFQVFLEWSHRLTAMVVGFGVIGLAALTPCQKNPKLYPPIITVFVLLALQIKLGAITVWFNNIHWTVAIHLANAMLVFASLAWLRRVAAIGSTPPSVLTTPRAASMLTWAMLPLVLGMMSLGAMVSSAHAGGVCGGLFSCDGQWLPSDFHQMWHMKHRYMAVILMAASIAFMVVAKRTAPHLRGVARHLHLMLWGQVALGILTLYSFGYYAQHYQLLSLAHLAWGAIIWLVAVGGVLTLVYGRAGRFHG